MRLKKRREEMLKIYGIVKLHRIMQETETGIE
jgi:hypothetical protein